MKKDILLMQTLVCLLVFAAVQSGIHTKEGRIGEVLGWIADAVRENYTLAELLELKDTAEEAVTQIPSAVGEVVLTAGQLGTYGTPMDEDSEDIIKNVYATAGGRVIRSGVSKGLGYYVIVEHPGASSGTGKISTYGHLSRIQAVTGDRVTKGAILGSYDSSSEKDFYYALEDKSGNIS